ncbi:Probable methionyl-tRNA synthetase, mitochondrial [Taphrina deformans PYCC 5710]|uniref:Probable methionine--tRNA ligase, mitochondrial n=1 Tax=Taphrina deformans (strain PYCC 5710 / ATCC 11124 / CBS 356.35 / IMI 108563 / JCM 9778 / NBRC 8474) TaxID=1097556 RepID=R4X9N8_TAPDE|nr:Probable methionyl-tRNA synthetase, mitochondrial [Taphrina deformans PYCC 5710]|eukprot:CCG82481.1 Probable methionyl-tRNA synthetase, mitochondrial [Taphrina deformans PYCC 5710]
MYKSISRLIVCEHATRSIDPKRSITPTVRTFSHSSSAQTIRKKPFYITTPIFYVNARPHVGHLYTLVLTDVLKRYRIFTGCEAVMLTGTDEHGMKIQSAAHKAKLAPQQFCDEVSEVFRELPSKANVEYDRFIRTTSPEHKDAVRHFWTILMEKGLIYKASHSGWYSVSDETFFPATGISQRLNLKTNQTENFSTETGNTVTWTDEQNYHFRLSAFKDRLLAFYQNNGQFVIPRARFEDVINSVTSELQDLSVSRPSSRLTWGVRVPNDNSQTIYVWLDALINYLTAAGYPNTTDLWPADVQVIGKDILRFHCIYWPAFLMAADIPLPKQIVTHAHWTMDNFKMSKSRGNVADPWMAINRFGVDSVRYYLMRDGRLENDGNYSSEHLIMRHNHELVNGLGNLTSRISSKWFDLKGILTSPPRQDSFDTNTRLVVEAIEDATTVYHESLSENVIHKAVGSVMHMVSAANALMQKEEPWSKSCSEKTRTEVLYTCLEAARIAALFLQPVMPTSMHEMLDRLGVQQDRRLATHARYGADDSYVPSQTRQPHIFSPMDTGAPPGSVPKISKLLLK